jgi:hypothetical protein
MTGRVQCAPGRFTTMKTKDREFLQAESGRRLESMLQRFSSVTVLVPWLRPGLSHADLRRTAARLRAGVIRVIDPRIPPDMLADVIEQSIAQELLVKSVAAEMIEFGQMVHEIREKAEAERARRFVAGFHRLKKSPEASDPDSKAAERVRRIHRERRKALGRPRKRGRRK